MKTQSKRLGLAALALLSASAVSYAAAGPSPLSAQAAPTLQVTATVVPFRLPDDIHLGEVAGVARSSNGTIYVYTRTGNPTISLGTSRAVSHGGSRLLVFDANGAYQREIGQGAYGLLQAQQVRVDPQNNVWLVDQMSSLVMKFDPNGRLLMVIGRKPEAMTVPGQAPAGAAAAGRAGEAGRAGAAAAGGAAGAGAAAGGAAAGRGAAAGGGGGGGGGGAPAAAGRGGGGGRAAGAGAAGESFSRPTDVAWDSQGNIYVADGYGNSRVAKYDRNGRWIKNWGSRGTENGQFNVVHGIAVDASDNVYVADRENGRIQVFDAEGNFKTQFTGLGRPSALCISRGANPYLFVSNSNPQDDIDVGGDIMVLDLSGRVLGRFGRAGKPVGEFGTVNAIDCQNPAELLVGEIGNWRVQRVRVALPARG
jgi:hypothetical protein